MGRMHEQWVPGSPFLPRVNLIEPEHEANMHYAAHKHVHSVYYRICSWWQKMVRNIL